MKCILVFKLKGHESNMQALTLLMYFFTILWLILMSTNRYLGYYSDHLRQPYALSFIAGGRQAPLQEEPKPNSNNESH